MPNRKQTRPLFLLLLTVALALCAVAQTGPRYGEFHPTNEYLQAFSLLSSNRTAAVSLFKQIAANNPGTALGANCLSKAAFYTLVPGEREQLYRAISAGYPDSRYDVAARLALVKLQYGYGQMQAENLATDALIRSFGAPGMDEILHAGLDRSALVSQFMSLPGEIRAGLSIAYRELMGGVGWQRERWDDALPIALFAREAFGGVDESELQLILTKGKPKGYTGIGRVDPQITIKSPKPGQRKGPRPRLKVRIRVGDFRVPQVDIRALEFELDGQSRRHELIVRTRVNPKLQEGKYFEKLSLTWRPSQPLSPGSHTITLVVPTGGYPGTGPGITRASLTFVVGKSHDDPEDERDEDDGDEDQW